MAIAVTCGCGRTFKAKDEHAGLRAKCPGCGGVVGIPNVEAGRERPEDTGSDGSPGLREDQTASALGEIRDLLAAIAQLLQPKEASPESAGGGGQHQYKVLTQKDKW